MCVYLKKMFLFSSSRVGHMKWLLLLQETFLILRLTICWWPTPPPFPSEPQHRELNFGGQLGCKGGVLGWGPFNPYPPSLGHHCWPRQCFPPRDKGGGLLGLDAPGQGYSLAFSSGCGMGPQRVCSGSLYSQEFETGEAVGFFQHSR